MTNSGFMRNSYGYGMMNGQQGYQGMMGSQYNHGSMMGGYQQNPAQQGRNCYRGSIKPRVTGPFDRSVESFTFELTKAPYRPLLCFNFGLVR